jgi:DNA-directed RNA polymerase II subunit RPB7
MYFKVLLYQNVYIPSRLFGEDIDNQILCNAIAITEGKRISPFGIVIIIISFFPTLSLGKILPGSSSALFRISYNAITFRAMKGELVDGIVTHVTKFGFFAEAGLLNIFVSKELVPSGFFYNETGNCFRNINEFDEIQEGFIITIRIVGIRNSNDNGANSTVGTIQAIGTMRGCYSNLIKRKHNRKELKKIHTKEKNEI